MTPTNQALTPMPAARIKAAENARACEHELPPRASRHRTTRQPAEARPSRSFCPGSAQGRTAGRSTRLVDQRYQRRNVAVSAQTRPTGRCRGVLNVPSGPSTSALGACRIVPFAKAPPRPRSLASGSAPTWPGVLTQASAFDYGDAPSDRPKPKTATGPAHTVAGISDVASRVVRTADRRRYLPRRWRHAGSFADQRR